MATQGENLKPLLSGTPSPPGGSTPKLTNLASPRTVFHTQRILDHSGHTGDLHVPTHRIDVLRIEKEAVISSAKQRFFVQIAGQVDEAQRPEWSRFCTRVDSAVRAWYLQPFDDIVHLYRLFDPLDDGKRIRHSGLTLAQVQKLEAQFLSLLFRVMNKANFKLMSDQEVAVATAGTYLLDLPIQIDASKLDSELLTNFFAKNPVENLPSFANQFLVFRRGVGMDATTGWFVSSKIDLILSKIFNFFLVLLCVRKYEPWNPVGQVTDIGEANTAGWLMLERVHISNMKITFQNIFDRTTLEEPTFERIIVIYRPASKSSAEKPMGDHTIRIKHFRNIPMADMEIVLPEKKTPGLTPSDWIKFLVTAATGLVAFVSSLQFKLSFSVISAILLALLGYALKVYFAWTASMKQYEEMIKENMYEKQLDSGRGTLLHLCDDVWQQEVKEAILAYHVLRTQGPNNKLDLDMACELLLESEFGEEVDFDVGDAIEKLEKLGIVSEDGQGRYHAIPLNEANEAIGTTPEELFSAGDAALSSSKSPKSPSPTIVTPRVDFRKAKGMENPDLQIRVDS